MRHLAVIGALLLLLTGCADARGPVEVARDYLAGDDPAKCDDADLPFLERETRREGDAARERCRRNVEETSPPNSVRYISLIQQEGRAEVRFAADGQDVRVLLRQEGERWLVTGFR